MTTVTGTDSWDFSRAGVQWDELTQLSMITLDPTMAPSDSRRLRRYRELWNHYEGFHWEGIPDEDKPQVTINYCRRFVDKFTSFLFGLHDEQTSGFSIKVPTEMEKITLPFLNSVWDAEYNDKRRLCLMMGQSGGVTGDVYLMSRFEAPGEFNDPFGEYPQGRLRIICLPSHIVFPIYDPSDRDKMIACVIKYPVIRKSDKFSWTGSIRSMFGRNQAVGRHIIYRQIWTEDAFQEWEGDVCVNQGVNPYNHIPVSHIVNRPLMTSYFGMSDIEDSVPMNREVNFKFSDNSEIIDYHSAPVTVLFGAQVNNLERGANKVWGGMPKDGKVETLSLGDNLGASVNHIQETKESMFEVTGIPAYALGKERSISNTSGVALQIEYMPLLEVTGVKRIMYAKGIRQVCRTLLLMGVYHNLIQIPTSVKGAGIINAQGNDVPDVSTTNGDTSSTASSNDTNTAANTVIKDANVIRRMFYDVSTRFPSCLPKDKILELEQLQLEMQLKLENRLGALKRLGRENSTQKLAEIDSDLEKETQKEIEKLKKIMSFGGKAPNPRPISKVVSGFNNGPQPKMRRRNEDSPM